MRSFTFKIALIILMASSITTTYAQDAHFSQFYASPVFLNPSMAGMQQGYRVAVGHRAQGQSNVGFSTSIISIDKNWGSHSGWGVQVLHDSQMDGVLNNMQYSAVFAHRIPVSKSADLGFGLNVGLQSKTIDWNRLVFEDQLHERNGVVGSTQEKFGRNNATTANIDAAVSYNSDKLFGGIKVSHLNQAREQLGTDAQDIQLKTTLHAGAMLPLSRFNDAFQLSPNIIYERQGTMSYTHVGMYVAGEVFSIGGWYRINSAIVGSVGMNVNDLRFGYSYDVAIGAYEANIGNAHELSLSYTIRTKPAIKNTYKGKCPKFQKRLF